MLSALRSQCSGDNADCNKCRLVGLPTSCAAGAVTAACAAQAAKSRPDLPARTHRTGAFAHQGKPRCPTASPFFRLAVLRLGAPLDYRLATVSEMYCFTVSTELGSGCTRVSSSSSESSGGGRGMAAKASEPIAAPTASLNLAQ